MPAVTRQLPKIVPPNWLWQDDSQGGVNSRVLPNTSGNVLLNVLAVNSGTPTLYLMIFDATAVPANTAVPILPPIPLTTNTPLDLWLNDGPGGMTMYGLSFVNGICYAVSTTFANLTLDATSSVWVNLRYQS